MSVGHRPSWSETACVLQALPAMDWNTWFSRLIDVMPLPIAHACSVHEPAYVADLVYDATFRVPSDGCCPSSFEPPYDMLHLVAHSFSLDSYQARYVCEHLYRRCGRWITGVPRELPRDTTNYMLLAPIINDMEQQIIAEKLFLGHADYVQCFSALVAHVHGIPHEEPIRVLRKWCVAHPHFDEFAVTLESRACAAVRQVLDMFPSMRTIRAHLSYTPTFIDANPYYKIELLLDGYHTDLAKSLL